MCTRVTKKRAFKTQSQQDSIMKYSFQSGFVSQQVVFLSQNLSQSMFAQFMQSMASQQFQNIQQSMNSQTLQNPGLSASPSANSAEEILSVSTETKNDEKKHTQFLNIMIDMNKVFRILCSMIKSNDDIVALNKQYIQADQGSDMNVIFMNLAHRFELQLRDLIEIEFRELFMRTANNHDTILYH
jgi:hypothetical protein